MISPKLILYVFALVLLLLQALSVPTPPSRLQLGWLGLFFWLLAVVIP